MEKHDYHQNSISMAASQDFVMPNDLEQQQQSQFPMRIIQEERPGQDFQNETPPQNNKSKQETS